MITDKKLIIIDGGPASGKNTLGNLLVKEFQKKGIPAILLDLDTYVEELNPAWIWKDNKNKEKDQQKARENYAKVIDNYLQKEFIVIAIGERFLKKEDIAKFISRLKIISPIYLYHLNVSFPLRKERLHKRGPHSLIDLKKDQKERDMVKQWYGYVYENINSPIQDANNIMKLIQNNKGLLDLDIF